MTCIPSQHLSFDILGENSFDKITHQHSNRIFIQSSLTSVPQHVTAVTPTMDRECLGSWEQSYTHSANCNFCPDQERQHLRRTCLLGLHDQRQLLQPPCPEKRSLDPPQQQHQQPRCSKQEFSAARLEPTTAQEARSRRGSTPHTRRARAWAARTTPPERRGGSLQRAKGGSPAVSSPSS